MRKKIIKNVTIFNHSVNSPLNIFKLCNILIFITLYYYIIRCICLKGMDISASLLYCR